MVCIRCQKRPAIIFVQRMENGQMTFVEDSIACTVPGRCTSNRSMI